MIRWVLVLLAAALLPQFATAQVKIVAQPQYQLHEPIVLALEGVKSEVPTTCWWIPLGKDGAPEPGCRIVDSNRVVHLWAPAGKYEVRCLITEFDVDWEKKVFIPRQSQVTATFAVGVPVPQPDPKPDPKPDPQPDPSSKYGLTAQALAWGNAVEAKHRSQAKTLADNFEGVAAAIAAGAYATPAAANQELAGRNRQVLGTDTDPRLVAWRPFFTSWSAAVTALNKDGKATTVQDYRELYLETAAGLKLVK